MRTGLEPATPGVTGRYSNQLNYRTIVQTFEPMEGIEPTTPRLQITCSGQLSYIGVFPKRDANIQLFLEKQNYFLVFIIFMQISHHLHLKRSYMSRINAFLHGQVSEL